MGTPEFAVPSLAALAATEEVTLVLCNPDRPAGRGRVVASPPVKDEAARLGIPVFQPEKARHPDAVARIAAEAPDLIVVVAYGHILPKSILEIPRTMCINVHASLLPKYRGAAPDQLGGGARRDGDRRHHHEDGRGDGHGADAPRPENADRRGRYGRIPVREAVGPGRRGADRGAESASRGHAGRDAPGRRAGHVCPDAEERARAGSTGAGRRGRSATSSAG